MRCSCPRWGGILETKKVYGSITTALFMGLMFYGCAYSLAMYFLGKPVSKVGLFPLEAGTLFCGFGFFMFAYQVIVPIWTYSDEGVKRSGSSSPWSEVASITRPSLGPFPTYYIRFKAMPTIRIGFNWTRNHKKVLSDVVNFVKKSNPHAEIDFGVLSDIR